MPVDLDAPTRAALAAFGDQAQKGFSFQYSPAGGQPFLIDGIFDEAWASIQIVNGRHGSASLSTTQPCVLFRLANFPAGVAPQQGDSITRLSTGAGDLVSRIATGQLYTVTDVNPDGFGCVHLPLTEVRR